MAVIATIKKATILMLTWKHGKGQPWQYCNHLEWLDHPNYHNPLHHPHPHHPRQCHHQHNWIGNRITWVKDDCRMQQSPEWTGWWWQTCPPLPPRPPRFCTCSGSSSSPWRSPTRPPAAQRPPQRCFCCLTAVVRRRSEWAQLLGHGASSSSSSSYLSRPAAAAAAQKWKQRHL